ncbi:MAG: hypothetical protein M1834_007501 [Cirrosporium novae-zelandiae]|nr:MAG: hypothetical protein M1834_007501 [Cirrosporium novae-zelandiae]
MPYEDWGDYRVGGLAVVYIGDILGDDKRYRIVHKLGYGGCATVWLARDTKAERYVAIKIMKGEESSEDCLELGMLEKLKGIKTEHPGYKHIAWALDHFWFKTYNGTHFCLVMPFVGPRVTDAWICNTLTGAFTRKIAYQTCQVLDFLHENGVGHGDMDSPNVLLQLADIDSWSEDDIYTRFGKPKTYPITNAELYGGPGRPTYAVATIDMTAMDFSHLSDQIMVIDFGEAFDLDDAPGGVGTVMEYCSPELLLEDKASKASDVWALGCTLFSIRTSRSLFEGFFGDENQVLEQIVGLLGKLPDRLWSLWGGRSSAYDENGVPKPTEEDGKPIISKAFTLKDLMREPAQRFPRQGAARQKPEEEVIIISPEEIEVFSDLLLQMLEMDPDKRISVKKVLEHPWFKQDFDEIVPAGHHHHQ